MGKRMKPEIKSEWKYGQLLVDYMEDGTEVLIIVELFNDEKGNWTSWCIPVMSNIEQLKMAVKDIERDGTNYDLYNTGVFTWVEDKVDGWTWDWKKNDL
jgi:hypothetical protein